jgi:hypothetical protein
MKRLLLVLWVCAACKGANDSKRIGEGSSGAGTHSRPAGDYWTQLTATKTPTLVGPFARLTLSPKLSVGAAKGQAPELFAKVHTPDIDWFEYASDDYPGMVFYVQRKGQIDSEPDTWLVGRLRVVAPADLAGRLTAAWGTPTKAGDTLYWYDPSHGMRAELGTERMDSTTQLVLDLQGYTPLATFIGTDPNAFGFEEGRPVVGASGKELTRRFGRRIFDGSKIVLWPTELAADETDVRFAESGDPDDMPERIEGYTIQFPDAAVDGLKAALEKKLGAPKPDRQDAQTLVYGASGPRIALQGNELQVGKRFEDD